MLPSPLCADVPTTVRAGTRALGSWLDEAGRAVARSTTFASVGRLVRWCAEHTGIPALVMAAILIVVGYRLLRSSARFAAEVGAVALILVALTEFGWIRW